MKAHLKKLAKEGAETVTRGQYGLKGRWLKALLLFSLSLGYPVGAQEIQGTFTLDDAVRLAKGNNPLFLQTANDEGPAAWAYRESLGTFLPSFTTNISGQYLATGIPSTGIFTGSDFGIGSTDYYFSGYGLTLSYNLSGSSFFEVASAKATQNATKARVGAAEFSLESTVTARYLIALRAKDGVDVARRQLERAEENYELAQARVDVGAAIPTDGKQADVERGRAMVALLEAESLLRTEKLQLLEQVGVQAEGDYELASEFGVFQPNWDRDDLVNRAATAHPSLQAFRAQESSGKARVRQAWSNYFPSLYFQVNWSGRAREIGDTEYLVGLAQGSMAGAQQRCQTWNQLEAGLNGPLDGYPNDCSVYVLTPEDEADILARNDVFPFNFTQEPLALYMRVDFPVFQGFRRQRQVAEAKAASEDARLNLRAEELRLETAVTQAYDELMTSTQVVEIETRNREVSEEQLTLAQERYRLGAAPFLELLEAQSSVAEAERDFLNAKYRFHGAIWALEAAVGERLRPGA
jgi:outer membrane protein TolC